MYVYATLYTLVAQVTTLALLASVRPFGRLTAKDEQDFFERLATTTLEERRREAFTTHR